MGEVGPYGHARGTLLEDEKVLKNPDEPLQEFGYSDLSLTQKKKYSEKIRFVAGNNQQAAKKTRWKLDRNIALSESS